jgi:hypothetical protein
MRKQDIKLKQAKKTLDKAIKRQIKGDDVMLEIANFSSKMADICRNREYKQDFKRKAEIFRKFAKAKEDSECISMDDLKCPVCNNPVNWIKNVGNYHYRNEIVLLAECWSGDIKEMDVPKHLFIIKLNKLPEIDWTEEDAKDSEE